MEYAQAASGYPACLPYSRPAPGRSSPRASGHKGHQIQLDVSTFFTRSAADANASTVTTAQDTPMTAI